MKPAIRSPPGLKFRKIQLFTSKGGIDEKER